MKFIDTKSILKIAQEDDYAIPAFNTNGGSYDITRAALEAAQECLSPLILQVYEPNCLYRGYDYFVSQANFLCDELCITVPVALHLDHGKSYESVMRAVKAGFTGVMFDASNKPLNVNIAETMEIVKVAHSLGISVEAEVGYVKGNEPKKEKNIGRVPVPEKPELPCEKTDTAEAKLFVEKTGVDMLAVSIGTTHGVYQHQTDLDFEHLKYLRKSISVPLVQHGTSGISIKDLSILAKNGMRKINFGECFRYQYINYFDNNIESIEHLWHPWRIMENVKDKLKEDMKELIISLGSENKVK